MKRVLILSTIVSLLIVGGLIYFRSDGTSAQTYFISNPAPSVTPSVTFTATPSSIYSGQSSTLSWTTTRADSCTMPSGFLNLGSTNVGTSGSKTVTPSSDTKYDITCTNSRGSTTEYAQVRVSPCTSASSCYGYTVSVNFTNVTVTDASGNNSTTVVSSPTHGPVTVNANPSDKLRVDTVVSATGSSSLWNRLLNRDLAECVAWPFGSPVLFGTGSNTPSQNMPVYSTSVSSWLGPAGVSGFNNSFFSVNYSTNQITLTATCGFGSGLVLDANDNISDSVYINIQTGQVAPQQVSSTLSATLAATPPTVTQPGLNQTGTTTLTATVGGTATGSVTYAFYCDASGNPLPVSSSNTTTCGYNSPGSYTAKVVVKRAGLSTTATTKVTVQAPGPSVSLQANPSSIRPGSSSTLSWSSANANSCTATGPWPGGEGAKNLSGSVSVSPSQSTTYYLSCSGPGGTAATSATVMIQGAPTLDIKIQ